MITVLADTFDYLARVNRKDHAHTAARRFAARTRARRKSHE